MGNDVWIDYYDEFPLVEIRSLSPERHWDMPIASPRVMAVSGNLVLLDGTVRSSKVKYLDWVRGYSLVSLSPEGGSATLLCTFEVSDTSGEPIKTFRQVGRGDTIFLIRGGDVFRITVAEALEATRHWQ